MNNLGVLLIGAIVRVTAFAVVGVALAVALRRRGPSAGVLVTLTTLTGLVAVSALSLSPWPRFWSIDPRAAAGPSRTGLPAAEPGAPVRAPAAPAAASVEADDVPLMTFSRAFVREFQNQGPPRAHDAGKGWRWTAWVAAGLLLASGLGFARLALAVLSVAAVRRGSRLILDPWLNDEVRRIGAETEFPRPVEARETDDVATPATVGWFRPVLLLPPDWRDWDARERRAVLAHELAHVRRGDYLSGLWAQACLAAHAYHPLAYWLVARLRFEQELAADAWGARLSGGARPYLEALARLALRRPGPSRPSTRAWPARPFLPTRGTLLRRIEMLRDADPNPPRTEPLSPVVRALTIAALVTAGLIVAGLRGPVAAQDRQIVAPPRAAGAKPAPAGSDVFDLSHAPINTVMAVAARPALILGRPEFRPVADLLNEPGPRSRVGSLDLMPDEVEGVVLLVLRGRDGVGWSKPPTVVFRATKPQDWKAVAGTFIKIPDVVQFHGQSYTRSKTPPTGAGYFTPDDRTIVVGTEDALQQVIVSREGGPIRHLWDEAWSSVKKGQVALAFEPRWVLSQLPPAAPGTAPGLAGPGGALAPLLEQATGYAIGLDLEGGPRVDLAATCPSADAAAKLNETMRAAITLAKNALPGLRRQVGGGPPPRREATLSVLRLVEPLLANARAEVKDGGVVRLRSHSDGDVASTARAIAPALAAARSVSARALGANNIKNLGLAMHNYLDVNGRFPPAVVRPVDGKPPYSWRVAILPLIDQNDLFKEYNFNEPWDGPSNRKLIAKMPALYGRPGIDSASGNAVYFVVTGASTLFPPGDPGLKIQDVTDGTSNTLMIVEAKREIPWTKPEDVVYDPAGPLPEFGGFDAEGFHAGFADGSAFFLPSRLDPRVLKAILTRAGGEVVSAAELRPERSGPAPATPALNR